MWSSIRPGARIVAAAVLGARAARPRPVSIAAMRPSLDERRCRSASRPRGRCGRWPAPARAVAGCGGRVAWACSVCSGTTMGDWRRHAIYFAPPRGQRAGALRRRLARLGPGGGRAARGLRPARAAAAAGRAGRGAAPLRLPRHAEGAVPPRRRAAARRRSTPRWRRSPPGARDFELGLRSRRSAGSWRWCRRRRRRRSPRSRRRCVTGLDGFRAPSDAAEIGAAARGRARRGRGGEPAALGLPLRPRAVPLPHDADRAAAGRDARAAARAALEPALAPLLAAPVPVAEVCRFAEGADGRVPPGQAVPARRLRRPRRARCVAQRGGRW